MKKTFILFLTIAIALILIFFSLIYVTFNGIPWKKGQVAKELEQYVETKYNTDVELVEHFYDFKFGSYGATFQGQEGQSTFTFTAEKVDRDHYLDYYVEELWRSQLKKDTEPIIKAYKNRLSIKSYDYLFIYGIANDLQIKGENIPNYKEVDSELNLLIELNHPWNEDLKEQDISETYAFITELKKNGIDNIGLTVNYKFQEGNQGKDYRIMIDPGEFNNIQAPSDIEKYLVEL